MTLPLAPPVSAPVAAPQGATHLPLLERIRLRAAELDRAPAFPAEDFADLEAGGALGRPEDGLAGEVRLVRAVAAASGSTARILDGHLNGLERLALACPEPLRSGELLRIAEEGLLLGVWGADPAPGEGPPARILHSGEGTVLRGVKTFCSGAGGVQRALVVAGDESGDRRLAYLDVTGDVEVDRDWYQASGLRSSESHRVTFHDTSVIALLGGPGELSREPFLARDGVRSAATWAGLADAICDAAVAALDPARADPAQQHALGRMRVARSTIDRWLDHAVVELATIEEGTPPAAAATIGVECRIALAGCARLISTLAAETCGSRALVGGGDLDRARRDLDLFLLQHRLAPTLTRLGASLLAEQ